MECALTIMLLQDPEMKCSCCNTVKCPNAVKKIGKAFSTVLSKDKDLTALIDRILDI